VGSSLQNTCLKAKWADRWCCIRDTQEDIKTSAIPWRHFCTSHFALKYGNYRVSSVLQLSPPRQEHKYCCHGGHCQVHYCWVSVAWILQYLWPVIRKLLTEAACRYESGSCGHVIDRVQIWGGGGNVAILWYYIHICSANDGIMLWRFSVACRLKLTDIIRYWSINTMRLCRKYSIFI